MAVFTGTLILTYFLDDKVCGSFTDTDNKVYDVKFDAKNMESRQLLYNSFKNSTGSIRVEGRAFKDKETSNMTLLIKKAGRLRKSFKIDVNVVNIFNDTKSINARIDEIEFNRINKNKVKPIQKTDAQIKAMYALRNSLSTMVKNAIFLSRYMLNKANGIQALIEIKNSSLFEKKDYVSAKVPTDKVIYDEMNCLMGLSEDDISKFNTVRGSRDRLLKAYDKYISDDGEQYFNTAVIQGLNDDMKRTWDTKDIKIHSLQRKFIALNTKDRSVPIYMNHGLPLAKILVKLLPRGVAVRFEHHRWFEFKFSSSEVSNSQMYIWRKILSGEFDSGQCRININKKHENASHRGHFSLSVSYEQNIATPLISDKTLEVIFAASDVNNIGKFCESRIVTGKTRTVDSFQGVDIDGFSAFALLNRHEAKKKYLKQRSGSCYKFKKAKKVEYLMSERHAQHRLDLCRKWCEQWGSALLKRASSMGCGTIDVRSFPSTFFGHSFPFAKLKEYLSYKCLEYGVVVTFTKDIATPTVNELILPQVDDDSDELIA